MLQARLNVTIFYPRIIIRVKIIQADHFMALIQHFSTEMGPDKTCPAGNKHSHDNRIINCSGEKTRCSLSHCFSYHLIIVVEIFSET